jgi:hypothetical protein
MRSPRVQARIAQNVWNKRQELALAHVRGITAGAKLAAKVARQVIESGWTDMEKFESEVWRRIRTGKK